MIEETHELTKQEATGKGRPGKEQKAKGTPVNCFATWLKVLGFMVIGLGSGLSQASCSDSGSFLAVHAFSAKMEASAKDSGSRSDVGRLLLTFPTLSRWAVAY